MTRALAVALAAVLAAAGAGGASTITLGRGIGSWKLGRLYVQAPHLVRSQRFPENTGPGCVSDIRSATRIDYYRTIRVGWRSGAHKRLYLFDVATLRAGDRSGDGFVIGKSRLARVRLAHPTARFGFGKGKFDLGATWVTSIRRRGPEGFVSYTYWFDAFGVLTALETGIGGC